MERRSQHENPGSAKTTPSKHRVVITGRPNVGKSTLFNRLIGERLSVEDAQPSTTRDRIQATMFIDDRPVELTDTGGILRDPETELDIRTQEQVEQAFDEATLVLFVVSLEEGVTAMDRTIAHRLRGLNKPVLVVANKQDAAYDEHAIYDFHEFGFGEVISVSALHQNGLDELLREIERRLSEGSQHAVSTEPPDIALIGRQNAGKSTFLNALAGTDRAIVTDEPGTTRDLIRVRVHLADRFWNVVDTPGMVRRGQTDSTADLWSQKRITTMIQKADVILHLIDATQEVTRVDKQISEQAEEALVPHIPVLNKWDLVPEEVGPEKYNEYLYQELVGTRYCPISFVSARKNFQLYETLHLAAELFEQAGQFVSSEKLTERIQGHLDAHPPPVQGRSITGPEIKLVEQTGVFPPELTVFVNDPSLFPNSYTRYLENRLRDWVPFSEVPFSITFVSGDN